MRVGGRERRLGNANPGQNYSLVPDWVATPRGYDPGATGSPLGTVRPRHTVVAAPPSADKVRPGLILGIQ